MAEILEQLAAEIKQAALGVGGQLVGIGPHEALERAVDHRAPLERPGVGLECVQRGEAKNPPDVEVVRVLHPQADVADRQLFGPGAQGRRGRRARFRAYRRYVVELARPNARTHAARVLDSRARQQRLQSHEPAAGYGRVALRILLGAREHHLRSARRLDEVVGRQPDPALDRHETQRLAHAVVEPRARVGQRGPGTFIEAAQQEQVRMLKPGLELAPDVQARVFGRTRAHRPRGHQLG